MKKEVLILIFFALLIGCTTSKKANIDLAGEWQFRLDPRIKGSRNSGLMPYLMIK